MGILQLVLVQLICAFPHKPVSCRFFHQKKLEYTMAKKNTPKQSQEKEAQVNDALKGFEIKINEFGQISSSMNIDKINEFLNKNVDDKKLKDR
ncbi:MAG: hypothetical protein ACPGXL_02165 [Chitinophagales bacterium]